MGKKQEMTDLVIFGAAPTLENHLLSGGNTLLIESGRQINWGPYDLKG